MDKSAQGAVKGGSEGAVLFYDRFADRGVPGRGRGEVELPVFVKSCVGRARELREK